MDEETKDQEEKEEERRKGKMSLKHRKKVRIPTLSFCYRWIW